MESFSLIAIAPIYSAAKSLCLFLEDWEWEVCCQRSDGRCVCIFLWGNLIHEGQHDMIRFDFSSLEHVFRFEVVNWKPSLIHHFPYPP